MIKNRKLLEEFERKLAKRGRLGIEWPPKDPLEGIEKDIKLAEVLRRYGEFRSILKMEEENET